MSSSPFSGFSTESPFRSAQSPFGNTRSPFDFSKSPSPSGSTVEKTKNQRKALEIESSLIPVPQPGPIVNPHVLDPDTAPNYGKLAEKALSDEFDFWEVHGQTTTSSLYKLVFDGYKTEKETFLEVKIQMQVTIQKCHTTLQNFLDTGLEISNQIRRGEGDANEMAARFESLKNITKEMSTTASTQAAQFETMYKVADKYFPDLKNTITLAFLISQKQVEAVAERCQLLRDQDSHEEKMRIQRGRLAVKAQESAWGNIIRIVAQNDKTIQHRHQERETTETREFNQEYALNEQRLQAQHLTALQERAASRDKHVEKMEKHQQKDAHSMDKKRLNQKKRKRDQKADQAKDKQKSKRMKRDHKTEIAHEKNQIKAKGNKLKAELEREKISSKKIAKLVSGVTKGIFGVATKMFFPS